MEVRDLCASRDHAAAVTGLFARAADYVRLETGAEPDAATVDRFLAGAPPSANPSASVRLGLFAADGTLAGIAELAFGFPEVADAYLGLLLLDPAFRGRGHGHGLLAEAKERARARRRTPSRRGPRCQPPRPRFLGARGLRLGAHPARRALRRGAPHRAPPRPGA